MVNIYRFIVLMSVFTMASVWSATIDVKVDRNVVEEGESLNVQFSSEQGIDGDPDFSPLEKDFRVQTPNRSYSMSFVNGKLSRSSSWSITLIPKRPGVLQIPKIHFGKDSSQPVRIQVKQASNTGSNNSDQLFILEADVDKKNIYVQSQIIYSVKIYHAVGLVNASLSEINLNDSDAIVEKLGDDLSYDKQLNGRYYKVFEKRFAIYPQKSGKLTIDPVVFEGAYASTRQPSRRTWPGINLSRQTQIKRLTSKKIDINVKPIPNNYKGTWVPAKELVLAEDWPDGEPKFVVGEPVTRMISIIAEGVLSTQIPEVRKEEIANIKQYSDQPILENRSSTDGIIGMRQESVALIPTEAGKYTLPAITVAWWNINKSRREVARIEERIIDVVADPNLSASATPTETMGEQPALSPGFAMDSEKDNFLDLTPNKYNRYLILISVSLLVGWILTIIAWWYTDKKQSKPRNNSFIENEFDNKKIKSKMTAACNSNNKILCKQLLLHWGKSRYSRVSPNSLSRLSTVCEDPLKGQIMVLNSSLYGSKANEPWDGKLLLKAFLASYTAKNTTKEQSEQIIKPLYYKVAS